MRGEGLSKKIQQGVESMEETKIMLRLTEILLKENLITPTEKLRIIKLIKKEGSDL